MGALKTLSAEEAAAPFQTGVHIGFDIIKAEKGGWVLSDLDPETGRSRRYVCQDAEALVGEIRAWSDRAIANFQVSHGAAEMQRKW